MRHQIPLLRNFEITFEFDPKVLEWAYKLFYKGVLLPILSSQFLNPSMTYYLYSKYKIVFFSYIDKLVFLSSCTMPFRFGYRTADLSMRSLEAWIAQGHISCSVPKCEWHITTINVNTKKMVSLLWRYSPIHNSLPLLKCIKVENNYETSCMWIMIRKDLNYDLLQLISNKRFLECTLIHP